MYTQFVNDPSSLAQFRDEIDRIFVRFFGDYQSFRMLDTLHLHRFPEINVWMDDAKVFVEAELPGLTENDIELTVIGSKLTIKGERRKIEPTDSTTVYQRERSMGSFSREIDLGCEVDPNTVETACLNGVLSITLPKVMATKPRQIPITVINS